MVITGWETKYARILNKFGYHEKQDLESAIILDLIIKTPISLRKIQKIIKNKPVFVIGAGPTISSAIPILKKYQKTIKIVADSAVKILEENKIKPDFIVTDLDGDETSLCKLGKSKSIFVVHAHGDNIAKLQLVENFKNCLGSTQTKSIRKIHNFGGFTDGDRSVFLASYFGASKIILLGMDFGTKIGKYSKTKTSERRIKLMKLQTGKNLLEWFATKTKSRLYTTSNPIRGFEKISYTELDTIIT